MLTRKDEIAIAKNAKSATLNVAQIMEEAKFRKIGGENIGDVSEYIKNYFKSRKEADCTNEFEIFIGTDSQRVRRGRLTLYATVICLYTVGKGAHIIYTRVKRDDIGATSKKVGNTKGSDPMLFQRLWWEVDYTTQVANYLKDKGVFIGHGVAQVHLDVSVNPENKSNAVYKSAVGYVEAMGYSARCKPEAVAASYAADMCVRG
jgi:predicted RNase H-related nuclease YkuK (DUF458 family)